MKVTLTLIATALFSSVAIAAPGFEKEKTENSVSHPRNFGMNHQVDTGLLANINHVSKRGIDGNTPGEKAEYRTNYILRSFRNYITSGNIDYTKFEKNKEELLEDVESTEDLVFLELPKGAFSGTLEYIRRFYESLKNASETKNRFEDCGYTGSNLVEQMMELNLRILALNDFDEMGDSHIDGFESKRSDLENKLTALEKTKEEMIPGIQKIFKEQAEIAKASLQLLKRFDEDEENSTNSSSGKKKDCPAI